MSNIDFSKLDTDGFYRAGRAAGKTDEELRQEVRDMIFAKPERTSSPARIEDHLTPFRRQPLPPTEIAVASLQAEAGMSELEARQLLMTSGIPEDKAIQEDMNRRRIRDAQQIERDAHADWRATAGGAMALGAEARREQEKEATLNRELGADARAWLKLNGAPIETTDSLDDLTAMKLAGFLNEDGTVTT